MSIRHTDILVMGGGHAGTTFAMFSWRKVTAACKSRLEGLAVDVGL